MQTSKSNAFDIAAAELRGYDVITPEHAATAANQVDYLQLAILILIMAGLVFLGFRYRATLKRMLGSATTLAVASALVLLLALLTPPWRITIKDSNGHTRRSVVEWGIIIEPPTAANATYQESKIAGDVMLVELASIAVLITSALMLRQKLIR